MITGVNPVHDRLAEGVEMQRTSPEKKTNGQVLTGARGLFDDIDYKEMALRAKMLHIPIEAMLDCVKKYDCGLKVLEEENPDLTFCQKWLQVFTGRGVLTKECQELLDIGGKLETNLHG